MTTDRLLDSLTSDEAERIIEPLRMGVPPLGFTVPFTVGRRTELEELQDTLTGKEGAERGRFLKANYGSGKSHLLRVIREMALDADYAVSFITMDAFGGVRGNRMDQIFEAVCRGIEIPSATGSCGLANLFAAAIDSGIDIDTIVQSDYWIWRDWDDCDSAADRFQSGACFKYRGNKTLLYQNCWNALTDLNQLAKQCGFNGLVLLVDEYEDVVTNLSRIDYQNTALENLLSFFDKKKFAGLSYFAVTPEFTRRWHWDTEFKLDAKPSFALTPPGKADIRRLARTIRTVHAIAYDLEPDETLTDRDLDRAVDKLLSISSQDRIRQTIKGIVKALDDVVE